VLDPEDEYALCLARDGDALESGIVETAESFSISWSARFRIDGPAMVVDEASGRIRTILG
jgi:hypothetical protein